MMGHKGRVGRGLVTRTRVCALLGSLAALSCGGGDEPSSQTPTSTLGGNAGSGDSRGLITMAQPPAAGRGSVATGSTPSTPSRPPAGAPPAAPSTPGAGGAAGQPAVPTVPTLPTTPNIPMMGAAAGGSAPAPAAGGSAAAAPSGGSAAPGTNVTGVPDAELEMLRQVCVDEINMYRATLPEKMLAPLKRATPEQEECSDRGAQMDGDSKMAHGAARAGLCRGVGLGAQNTCPGWGVGGRSGNGTVADALKGCLRAMWDEGEPPVSREMCQQDYQGCFLAHGHYLNMSGNAGAVACSFYKMSDGKYWMNQDFGR
ncbi:MAG: hypothetical protein ABW321_17335 [Polyangiales bacterium]